LEREPSGLFGRHDQLVDHLAHVFHLAHGLRHGGLFGFARHFAGEQHGAVVAGHADLAQRGQAAHARSGAQLDAFVLDLDAGGAAVGHHQAAADDGAAQQQRRTTRATPASTRAAVSLPSGP
jgi:hypothetical protein